MEENQKQEKRTILSICCWGIAALISVAFFCMMDHGLFRKNLVQKNKDDKIDSTVLPESKGENPFVGKIYSSPERTIRYIFQSEDSLMLEHIYSMDSKFNMPFSIRCSYSVNSIDEKLFMKPMGLVQDDFFTSSSSEISSILNETLVEEILGRYPNFENEENFSELKDLSLERAKKLVCENLFEIFSFDYSQLPSALLVEELFPKDYLIRREGLRFISDDDSKIFKIAPAAFYFVYDDKVTSFSYGALPDYENISEDTNSENENTEVKLKCNLKFFDSDLALGNAKISDAGNLEAKIYIDENSRTVQSVDVYMEILSAPESFCLSAGEKFKTRLPSAELLEWMRLEGEVPQTVETEEKK